MKSLDVNLPFAIYLLSLLGFAVYYLNKVDRWRITAEELLTAGWLAQTALLGRRWIAGGRAPLANQFESLLLLSWACLLVYLILRRRLTVSGAGFWIAALCLLILAAACLFDSSIQPLMPALQSNWLLYHVVVVMVGYAAFAVAAVGGGLYLACYRGQSGDPSRLEKAASLDGFTFRAVSLGFVLLTGGILLGSVWANEAWGSYWSWDPKETWSLITWLVYAVTIHLRRTRGWMGARFAWLALIGFFFVLFTYFGVNFLIRGLHSYA